MNPTPEERAEVVRMAQEEGRTKPVYVAALREIRAAVNAALEEAAQAIEADPFRSRILSSQTAARRAAATVRMFKSSPEP